MSERCPTESQLALLALGRASPDDAGAVLTHIDGCSACRALTAELARGTAGDSASSETPGEAGPASEPVRPGASIGRYIVLHRLGAGGMGVVYSAYDPQLDRNVALKLLRPRRSRRGAPSLARLEHEARSLARVSHPHVVAVHDVGTYGDRVTLVMELVEGVTLRAWLGARLRRPGEVLHLLCAAGEGLRAVHDAGVVHRDVKPENVLVGKDGRARITDFGLAMLDDELAAAGVLAGTMPYMAPEQLRGEPADARSDQFAFAAMVHEALIGARPFEGKDRQECLAAIARGLPARPRGVDRRVWTALRRALDADAARRFSSMTPLLAELAPPARGARGAAVALVAAAVVAAGTVGVVRERRLAHEAICRGGPELLSGVWDDARRDDVARAFRAHPEVPFAETTLASTRRVLDGYARAWTEAREGVCEATRIRGDQSEALMDQRMACLDDRRRDLRGLVDGLARAAPKAIELAVQATGALGPVQACASARSSQRAPAADAVSKAKTDDLRAAIADARWRVDLGDVAAGRRALDAALPDVRALGDTRLLAETELLRGQTLVFAGELADAEASLLEAVWAADSGGDDDVTASAYLRLAQLAGNVRADQAAGARYERHAEATIARLGSPSDLQAELLEMRAARLGRAADYEGAATLARRALDLLEAAGQGDSRRAGACWNSMAAARKREGRLEEARAAISRAVDIRQRLLGAAHPETIGSVTNRGTIEIDEGRLDDALRSFEAALAGTMATTGDLTQAGALVHNDLGLVREMMGDLPGARAEFARAEQIGESVVGDHPSTALAQMNVADLDRTAGHPAQALPEYARAQEILGRSKSPDAHTGARILSGLGQAQLDLRRPADAQATLERSLAMFGAGSFDPADRGEAEFALARALAAQNQDPARAAQLAGQARDAYSESHAKHDAEKAAITAWLAARVAVR